MKLKESKFQFSNPRIIMFHFNENPEYQSKGVEGKNRVHVVTKTHIEKDEENKRAKVYLSLKLGEKDDPSVPYFIYVKMVGDFFWKDISENNTKRFLKINAPAVLFSYMRPYIAMITNASDYSTLNLPFMNFQDSVRDSESNE